jgi:hypothetical protein
MNIYYENVSLADDPAGLLKNLLALSLAEHEGGSQVRDGMTESSQLEQAFLDKSRAEKAGRGFKLAEGWPSQLEVAR